MRGKKALGLICGWPSRGGWKEMTSDTAQVTKQGSEVNIKCLQSTKCKISSSFPVYSAVLFFFLKIPEQENVNYQKVFLLIIFKLHFRVLVLCSKNQPEIILLFLRMQNLTFSLTSKYSKSESSSKLAGSLFSCRREKALPILFQIKKILFLD